MRRENMTVEYYLHSPMCFVSSIRSDYSPSEITLKNVDNQIYAGEINVNLHVVKHPAKDHATVTLKVIICYIGLHSSLQNQYT